MDWDISDAFPIDGLVNFSPLRSQFIGYFVARAWWEIGRENGLVVEEWNEGNDEAIIQIMQDNGFHDNPIARAKSLLSKRLIPVES